MEKLLLRTKAAVADCGVHLESSKGFGTEIESYLTQYLLVVLCADIQQEIYKLCEERVSITNDPALLSYVSSTSRRVLRSIGKDEIAKFVGMFGVEAKAKLNGLVSEADIALFNNAVNNRHEVAHKQGVQLTFRELKETILVAERILGSIAQSLRPLGSELEHTL